MLSKRISKKPNSADLPLFDRAALTLLFLFVLTDVLSGAIRYYAVQLHLAWLPYLPHLLLAASLLPLFFVYLVSEGVNQTFLTVLVLFGSALLYGTLNLNSAIQVEFGLWIFVPFLYGIVALPAIIRGWRKMIPYALALWALAVLGVLINLFYSWPWVGFEYQVGATSIEASRLWTTAGIHFTRLPGFSGASFSAGLQLLISSVFLSGILRRKWWIPVWVLSGVAIVLTTSKTPLLIFILFSITRVFRKIPRRKFWRYVPLALACFDILLPFSMLLFRADWLDSALPPLWNTLILSVFDRFQLWPEWLHMIVMHGSLSLGRGMGGIGAAQQYFEPALYSPGDNIAVYIYGTFGALGIIFLLVYGWGAARIRVNGQIGRFFFLCTCLVLLEGATVNIVEGGFLAMVFGASFRYLQDFKMAIPLRVTQRCQRTSDLARPDGSRPARA